jgi:hypothetical protein
MTPRKSKRMKQVEEQHGEDIQTILPRLLTELGHAQTAEQFGVSQGLLGYWCLKLGVKSVHLYLAPDETYQVVKA